MTIKRQPMKTLLSFHYFRTADLDAMAEDAGLPTLFMGDSGAFSAASSGTPIQYTEYTTWLRRWEHRLFCYPTLDVIGDPQATWHHWRRMRRASLTPLPVVHYGTSLDWLHRYLDAGERYIALGGLVGSRGPNVKRWLIACFRAARPYGAVFHGFGRTHMEDLRDFPWYSVDSSTISAAIRFGRAQLFDGRTFRSILRNQPKKLYAHGRLLRAHGVTPEQMDNRHTHERQHGYTVGTLAWRRCEEWMRHHHGPVPGPRDGDPPGPHIFLAEGKVADIHRIAVACRINPGPYFPAYQTSP